MEEVAFEIGFEGWKFPLVEMRRKTQPNKGLVFAPETLVFTG